MTSTGDQVLRAGAPRPARSGITALIHTKDEERNIARAIRSVQPFVDEVMVVDMASTDATVALAERLDARVVHVPDFGYMEPARALALAEVRTDWVLICDADEVIPATLGRRLRDLVQRDDIDVVVLHGRTFMFGAELKGSGWSRAAEAHPKLYRVGGVQDFPEIHKQPEPRPESRVLDLGTDDEVCYLHFNYTDLSHFVAKLDRYTTAEVLKPDASSRVTARVAKELAWRLVAQRAWRDGYRGILLVHLMVAYRLLAYGKSRLLRECGSEAEILASYEAIADAAMAGPGQESK